METEIFKNRREKIGNCLDNNSVILIPGADLKYRNADSSYFFRQESDFFYLSGFCEPSSLLAIKKTNDDITSIIFVPPKDKLKEIWDGYRAGPEGAVKDFMFDEAYENTQIDDLMPEIIHGFDKVIYSIGKKQNFDQNVINWVSLADAKDRHSKSIQISDMKSLVGNMRLIKDQHELKLIKKACDISLNAHIYAMKNVKVGDNEQQIEAMYLHEFSKNGGRFPAYTPIVAGGENACVLHYIQNNNQLKDADLLLVDAGCEYEMYASDITRTFPVNGKFSKEQAALYDIVLEANLTAIDYVKTGKNIMDPQIISEKIITNGLVKLGILEGDVDELHEKGAYKDFYMHKIGHWLGLDVHDSGDYMENEKYMNFKPGMVTTIEPGIYINSSMNVADKWKGIGIRIEDNILVTEEGNINFTRDVPSDPGQIESLMS